MRAALHALVVLSLILGPALRGADIVFSLVLKLDVYEQSTNGGPSYAGSAFMVEVIFSEPVSALPQNSVRIVFPGGYEAPLDLSGDSQQMVGAQWLFQTRSALDAFAPDGVYRIICTDAGGYSRTLALSGGTPPPPARIANWNALQNLATGPEVEVSWTPDTATFLESDFLLLAVEDDIGNEVYSSAQLWDEGTFTGLDTHANVLVPPGKTSTGTLIVFRATDLALDGGQSIALAARGTAVVFPIRSVLPRDLTPPTLVSVSPANQSYGIDASASLVLTFDEPMLLRGSAECAALPELTGTWVTWSQDRRTATIVPPAPWPVGTQTVMPGGAWNMARQFADISGNAFPLAQPFTTFFVGRSPLFTTQPPPLTTVLFEGEAVEIRVAADWPGQVLQYQWTRNGAVIPGATAPTLRIDAFGPGDEGCYQVRITNEFGVTSGRRVLVMMNQRHLIPRDPLMRASIGSSAQTIRIAPGGSLELSCVWAQGVAPFTYQWRRDGVALTGDTDVALSLTALEASDTGVYDLVISNRYGTCASEPFAVEVTTDLALPAPATTRQRIIAAIGERLFMSSGVTEPITHLRSGWRLNGSPLQGGSAGWLEIASLDASQFGTYAFVVSNGASEVVAAEFEVVLRSESAPQLVAPSLIEDPLLVSEARTASIAFTADGASPLSLQWYKDGVPMPGATNALLEIPAGAPSATGAYVLRATNPLGSAESGPIAVRYVSVRDAPAKPRITTLFDGSRQQSGVAVLEGGDVRMQAVAEWTPAEVTSWTWKHDGVAFAATTSTSHSIPATTKADAGLYTVTCSNAYASTESDPFRVQVLGPADAPVVSSAPVACTAVEGSVVAIPSPIVFPANTQVRWFAHGFEITQEMRLESAGRSYEIPCVQLWHQGVVTMEAVNPGGRVVADAAVLTVVPAARVSSAHLVNVSTRAVLGEGAETLIAGFAIEGTGSKRLLIRGIGTGLRPWIASLAAGDSRLTVYRGPDPVAGNEDWIGFGDVRGLYHGANDVGAFFTDPENLDAALLFDAPRGLHTVHVHADALQPGVGLGEVYDLDGGYPASRVVNLSSRVLVGTGDELAIPGFVIAGRSPGRYLIRAVGPGLTAYGVEGVLENPQLTLNGSGVGNILRNDDWEAQADPDSVVTETRAAGGFALKPGSRDAAIVATLPPGSYTVLVTGVGGATGVALVEVYQVPWVLHAP